LVLPALLVSLPIKQNLVHDRLDTTDV